MNKLILFSLATGLLASGCTNKISPQQIHEDISSSLQANQSAKNMNEWESSEFNTENLFLKWRVGQATPADVCEQLLTKTPQELALFEEDIKASENKDLVGPCQNDLLAKIESYWAEQRSHVISVEPPITMEPATSTTTSAAPIPGSATTLQNLQMNFKFPDNNQTRDVSHGYTAVKGDLAMKEVILTFDDGPHAEYTDMILSALRKVNAKAIFFAMGKNVVANRDVLRREAASGMSIGSHSVDHKCLPANAVCTHSNGGTPLTFAQAVAEITGGHRAVYETLGWVDPFFRFPYGEYSPELKQFLNDHGTAEFFWTIDSEDWKNQTPQQMVDNTFHQLDALGRGIILFHDIQRKTAETLPLILSELYFKGYSVVGIRSSNPNDRRNSKLLQVSAASVATASPAGKTLK